MAASSEDNDSSSNASEVNEDYDCGDTADITSHEKTSKTDQLASGKSNLAISADIDDKASVVGEGDVVITDADKVNADSDNTVVGNDKEAGKEDVAPEICRQRQAPQPTKRRPDKDLNHDNWDQEDEPEEKGEFIKASEDQLKDRKILTAKRKHKSANQSSGNPFGAIRFATNFGGVQGGTSNVTSMFNFSSTQPQSTPPIPNFDFSNICGDPDKSVKDDDKKDGFKKIKTRECDDSVTEK